MKLQPESPSESKSQPDRSQNEGGSEDSSPATRVSDVVSRYAKHVATAPRRVPAKMTRRNAIKVVGGMATMGEAVAGMSGSVLAQDSIIAKDGAGYSTDGQPEKAAITATDFTLSWDSLQAGDAIIVEFQIAPSYSAAGYETIGSTAVSVDSSSGSAPVTASDLFPDAEGDITTHPGISLSDMGVDVPSLSNPTNSELINRRTFDIQIYSWLQSTGGEFITYETSFDILYAVECGFGYNFGWVFGRKVPKSYDTNLAELNV